MADRYEIVDLNKSDYEIVDLAQFNQNPSVVNPQTGNPMAMPDAGFSKTIPQHLGEFAGEVGGGVAGEALGLGLLGGLGLSNPLTAVPAAGILAGMGSYLGGNLAREATGTQTPRQDAMTLADMAPDLAAAGGAGAALNVIPGALQARAARKFAEKGFLAPTAKDLFEAGKELGAPVGLPGSGVGSMGGVGNLVMRGAAEDINRALLNRADDFVGKVLNLETDAALVNSKWGNLTNALKTEVGEAPIKMTDDAIEAVRYFASKPSLLPPKVKKAVLDMQDNVAWPGMVPGARVYAAELQGGTKPLFITTTPMKNGNLRVTARIGKTGKLQDVTKGSGWGPQTDFTNPNVLELISRPFGAEKTTGIAKEIATGNVTFDQLNELYKATRGGLGGAEYRATNDAEKLLWSKLRDGSEESIKQINDKVSEILTTQHQPFAAETRAAGGIQKAIQDATETLTVNGQPVRVLNSGKAARNIKSLEGVWMERTTGSSLITAEQRQQVKQFVKLLEATAADQARAAKMLGKDPKSLLQAVTETLGSMGGGGLTQTFVPVVGPALGGVAIVAPAFDALAAMAMLTPTGGRIVRGAATLSKTPPKLMGKAIRYGLPGNVGEVFGDAYRERKK